MNQAPILTCIAIPPEVRKEDPHTQNHTRLHGGRTNGIIYTCSLPDFRPAVKRDRHRNLLTQHVDGNVVALDVYMATSSLARHI